MSGCSFITIGRTQHTYSHLDKNLSWTVQTVRAIDVQYVKLNNVTLIDDTVSVSEKDETILSLHKSGQEQEEEIRRLNYQLTNLSSTLQAANNLANDEAGVKQGLSRTAQEQKEEIKRLNLQLSSLSSQLQANTEKEETLRNFQESTFKQKEEITKLNHKIVQLSILLEIRAEYIQLMLLSGFLTTLWSRQKRFHIVSSHSTTRYGDLDTLHDLRNTNKKSYTYTDWGPCSQCQHSFKPSHSDPINMSLFPQPLKRRSSTQKDIQNTL